MNELASKTDNLGGSEAIRLWSRISSKLPQWVALLLVIVVAWQLAMFVLQILAGGSQPVRPLAPAEDGSIDRRTETDISVITDAALFGNFAENSEPAPGNSDPDPGPVSDVPETTLDLTLKGTIWDSERDRAVAIIEYRNEEKVYTIGAVVVAGATLYLVEPHRVILQRTGGRLEELNLAELSQISTSERPQTRRSRPRSLSNVTRNTILQSATNSGALSEIIRPQPYFADGRLKGYRIYPGRQRRTFAELGFRPGDLATNINGVPLTDPEQSANMLGGIEQSGQLSVTVERNGIPEVITIDLDQISSALRQSPPGTQRR
ncbi:MAG: type II secretion system protein GspC [Gammaproteobacteria bacterium]|nr:type II secretion system protein GspC [Gammaproteobacteria bacterium]